jgi:phosphomannomutase
LNPSIFQSNEIVGLFDQQFNHDDAWKIGNAAGRFLPSLVRGFDRGRANTQCICVGHDMRTHSPALAERLIEGIRCASVNVIDIGMTDTPQLYFAVKHLGTCGGIQVTASHKSARYNGLKISGQNAIPIGIDTGLSDIKHLGLSLLHTKGIASGSIQKMDLLEEYKRHILRFLGSQLVPFKIAIDASNGMAGKLIPLVFADLDLDIIEINFKYSGMFKHTPDPLIAENLAELKKIVCAEKCNFGLCFDGGADGVVLLDENGQQVPGDLLTALMVPYFLKKKPRSTVVYDQRSSRVVSEEIIKNEGTPRRERVGHCYMQKAMRDSHAIFGGDLSGHFYYGESACADSGLITLVHMLNTLNQTDRPVSELVRPLYRYFRTGELSFPVEDKQTMMHELGKLFADGKIDRLDGITIDFKDWWFTCRPSHTEPFLRLNVEAKTQDLLDEKLGVIKKHLGEPT